MVQLLQAVPPKKIFKKYIKKKTGGQPVYQYGLLEALSTVSTPLRIRWTIL
jgi:hypothetical protein